MRKRILALLLCAAMLTAAVLPVAAEKTEETVTAVQLSVSNTEEFLAFAENCRLDTYSQNLAVTLEQNIDLTGSNFQGVPVFSGTFDGKGHRISGLQITHDGSKQGLFRHLTATATVKNLTVSGQIQPGGSQSRVGGIAGQNDGQIQNCTVSVTVSGADYVGGIAGSNSLTATIENCKTEGHIYGNHFVGGIAGENAGVIRGCENTAQINVTPNQNSVEISDINLGSLTNTETANTVTDIGGIAGSGSGVIRECENRANVGYRHMGYNIGGIAGSQSGYITDCANYGQVQGRKEVGGIAGQMEPALLMDYSEDAMQTLEGQLEDLSGMVNRVSYNAQTNAQSMLSSVGILRDQVQTATDAVQALLPDENDPQLPDPDKVLAAQNALSETMNAMPATMEGITKAAQNTAFGLSRDLNAISSQLDAMGKTVESASENLGGAINDVSDQDTEDQLTGKVAACENYGDVLADLNVGGIAGAVAPENDMDVLEDWQSTGEESLNFQSQVRAVILNCENYGCVTGKKQNAGGIAGWQSLGLVKNCANTGKVDGAEADYVGGICGLSSGYIRFDYARCEIHGKTNVGGIAGSAAVTTDSLSQVKLVGGKEKLGAILGYAQQGSREEKPFARNLYLCVDGDPGAVDGISYAGVAEPASLEDFMATEGLPELFQTVTVRFVREDGTVTEVPITPGGALEKTQIPALGEKDGYAGQWQGMAEASLTDILFDMTFTAAYTAYKTVIQSTQTDADGLPILLAEGSFTGDVLLTVTEADGAVPEVRGTVLAVWEFTLSEPGTTARIRVPQAAEGKPVMLLVCDDRGQWQETEATLTGSYLSFILTGQQGRIALVQKPGNTLWILGGIGLLILAAVVIPLTRRAKKQPGNPA